MCGLQAISGGIAGSEGVEELAGVGGIVAVNGKHITVLILTSLMSSTPPTQLALLGYIATLTSIWSSIT